MSEWWTYAPEDFLLFSPRTYWRMFELQNAELWPAPLLTFVAGLLVILLAARPMASARGPVLIMAILWVFVGWTFLWNRYANINWAIAYVAPAFAVESLLLIIAGLSPRIAFDQRGFAGWIGYFLLAFALVGLPVLAQLQGRSWAGSEIVGMAPDPTAIATLGLLCLLRGRFLWFLHPIPILWCILSGVTLHTMQEIHAAVPYTAVALTLAARTIRRRQRPPRSATGSAESSPRSG